MPLPPYPGPPKPPEPLRPPAPVVPDAPPVIVPPRQEHQPLDSPWQRLVQRGVVTHLLVAVAAIVATVTLATALGLISLQGSTNDDAIAALTAVAPPSDAFGSSRDIAPGNAAAAVDTIVHAESVRSPDGVAADSLVAHAADSLARGDDDSSAAHALLVPATPNVVPKTLAPPALPPPLGAWFHGDNRTERGDSLVVVLLSDGSASAFEQRWRIREGNWTLERTQRRGRWELRQQARTHVDLCIEWLQPASPRSCARVRLNADPVRMEYGGRYWHRGEGG